MADWAKFEEMCKDPAVCNANAYSLAIDGQDDVDPHPDWMCRQDLAANGSCWCGKLTGPGKV